MDQHEPRKLNPDSLGRPIGQYSNVVVTAAHAETVCIAGQLPLDAEGRLAAPAFADQADLVFSKLQAALASVGALPIHLVEIRSYLTRADDLPAFRAARERWFAAWGLRTPPAATTLVVQALVGEASIELDARAVVPSGA